MKKIKLHGDLKDAIGDRGDIYLIGELDNGSIATKEQYDSFEHSIAHCFSDGVVRQRGTVIGRTEDVEIVRIKK